MQALIESQNQPRVKLCGLRRSEDIAMANNLKPEYIGFVFASQSHRFVTDDEAARLKSGLDEGIQAVGVFVNEPMGHVAQLLDNGVIDVAQLHGSEDETYIAQLRALVGKKPIIQAFTVKSAEDINRAEKSSADYILLDSSAGSGRVFDWSILTGIQRPYFLAGGLNPDNVTQAVKTLHPFALDVSSGIEIKGYKDFDKAAAFVAAARKE